ncbi:MAG: hypothetical protein ACFNPX_07930, partial [Neisseria subflava]
METSFLLAGKITELTLIVLMGVALVKAGLLKSENSYTLSGRCSRHCRPYRIAGSGRAANSLRRRRCRWRAGYGSSAQFFNTDIFISSLGSIASAIAKIFSSVKDA